MSYEDVLIYAGAIFVIGFVSKITFSGYQKVVSANKPKPSAARGMTRAEVAELTDKDFIESKKENEALRRVAKEHEKKTFVYRSAWPVTKNPPYTFRILPPAKNHEVFGTSKILNPQTFEGEDRYYYNVIIRGQEAEGPKVLSVPLSIHRQIVEAFTKPEDDDISDVVNGRDLTVLPPTSRNSKVVVTKGPNRPLSTDPQQAENWLKRTFNLSDMALFSPSSKADNLEKELKAQSECYQRKSSKPIITAEQKPRSGNHFVGKVVPVTLNNPENSEKKRAMTNFNIDMELFSVFKKKATEEKKTLSDVVNDLIKNYVDETEDDVPSNHQIHFSKGEKVLIKDQGQFYTALATVTDDQYTWGDFERLKHLTTPRFWGETPAKQGDVGEIVGFVMRKVGNKTFPHHDGAAIVKITKSEIVAHRYVCVGFKGLQSLDNNAINNAVVAFREGDWVHWTTQAGTKSVRPSVIFKIRTKDSRHELQLGFVSNNKIVKFWIPASKCEFRKDIPKGFAGLLAHRLPESVLAEKLNLL